MMQRFACVLLVASAVLLGLVVPSGAASLQRRETNAQRFARGLPPLPPIRRTSTDTAKRSQASPQVQTGKPQPPPSGRLEVRWAVNGSVAGYIANNATAGPIGLNLNPDPNQLPDCDLHVEYSDSSLVALDAKFPAPFYVGGNGTLPLAAGSPNTIEFINVEAGPWAAVWALDWNTGVLNATWTNPDGSKDQPSLAYDPALNALNFTGDFTALYNLISPPTQYLVNLFLVSP
ncbi:hypothetical protein BC834DRAFT_906271 [Gloeopeniophorella convolvens]|nr:hypothetical protein BC834DRAFT_906271 [Gloeopeniophorella convolvens]